MLFFVGLALCPTGTVKAEKTYEDKFTYEGALKRLDQEQAMIRGQNNKYSRKSMTWQVDPNIWVYTSEFAERFGMPEEWARCLCPRVWFQNI